MAPDDHAIRSTIGQSPGRREDDRFLTGTGCFLDDLAFEGLAHGVVLRSPHAHAEILRLDTTAAAALPGVLAVITGAEWRAEGLGDMPTRTAAKNSDGSPVPVPPQPILAQGQVVEEAAGPGQKPIVLPAPGGLSDCRYYRVVVGSHESSDRRDRHLGRARAM